MGIDLSQAKIAFISRMTVKEGREADFERLAAQLTEQVSANEPDTLVYRFFKLRDGPRRYAVLEAFPSEAAEEAHLDTEYFKAIAPELVDCLDGSYVREYLDPIED